MDTENIHAENMEAETELPLSQKRNKIYPIMTN